MKKLIWFLVLGGLFLIVLGGARPSGVQAALEAPSVPVDTFGYVLQSQSFSWIDATSGTQVSFPSPDNSYAGPINIGFTLPFYEFDYSQLYIATNGLVSFGQGTLLPITAPIPSTTSPNNIVPAFWDDLELGAPTGGAVYYLLQGSTPNRKFVIAWESVHRTLTPSNALTFEIILHENGDVCYQYFTLSGTTSTAVAGIEDSEGEDGFDNSGGVGSFQHFCFIRPPAAARVKVTPGYQGQFITSGSTSFQLKVRNTGALGTDTYDLDFISTAPGWGIGFTLNQLAPLVDTNGNGFADTGPIPQGGVALINVTTTAPPSAVAGDNTTFTVTATSQLNPSVSQDVIIQNAIPAGFALAYQDSQAGPHQGYYAPGIQVVSPTIFPGLLGSLSMSETASGNYIYLWEYTYLNSNSKTVTEIQYSLLTRFGAISGSGFVVNNNNNQPLPTADKSPAAAGNPNGKVAVVYVVDRVDDNLLPSETNSNVYLVVLNPDGTLAAGPVNLTQNTDWRAPTDFNEPLFSAPRVAAVGSDFLVTWIDNRLQSGSVEEDDVYGMILSETGATTWPKNKIADSAAGGNRYALPAVSTLSTDRALVAYTMTDAAGNPISIKYKVLDDSGSTVKNETTITGSAGSGIDAVELSDGSILIAWIDASADQPKYAMMNASYNISFGPAQLTTPIQRDAIYLSVTQDDSDHGIITWMDATASQYLFYALLDTSGIVLTPPMAFRQAASSSGFVITSKNGGGLAPFEGALSIFLPAVMHK